jgi:hypothetical protein
MLAERERIGTELVAICLLKNRQYFAADISPR